MSKLKLYKPSETLNKGSMVRLDSPLFIAVMGEAINEVFITTGLKYHLQNYVFSF